MGQPIANNQMSIHNIFGLNRGNKMMNGPNMFGIPSDGCEGLAMKQRYRALHPNINQLRSIPAPKIKKDNYFYSNQKRL